MRPDQPELVLRYFRQYTPTSSSLLFLFVSSKGRDTYCGDDENARKCNREGKIASRIPDPARMTYVTPTLGWGFEANG